MSINSPSSFKKSVSGTGSCEKEVSSRLGFAGITSSVGIKFVFFVQCDQRKLVYTFYDLSAALSIPSFLFVLIPNACVAFFLTLLVPLRTGVFFF